MSGSSTRRNPFPGLRPYDESDRDWFFGRDDHIRDVLGHLRRTRFIAVLGSSGCGKSSLIRAGVLPPLRNGFMASTRRGWRIAVMRPGDQPIKQLARALSATEEADDPNDDSLAEVGPLEATLRRTSFGVVDVAKQANFGSDQKLLILVDQFEELFRFVEERSAQSISDETRAFVKLLIEASRQREIPIYVIITMRSEFLGNCTPFPNLPEAINRGLYLVPRLSREQLRHAVEQPVAQAEGEISNRLVNRLLNDCGDDPDQLPLLQHALTRLWTVYVERKRATPIDLDDYDAIGGLSGALSQHVTEIYEGLTAREQGLAEAVFRNLTDVTADGHMVRRPNSLRAICAAAGATAREIENVVNQFRDQGRSFLMPPMGEKTHLDDNTKIDISHESLIRQWAELRDWTLSEATHRRVGRMVAAEAKSWEKSGRNEGLLLTGVRLAEAIEWARRPTVSVVLKGIGKKREVNLGWLKTDEAAVDEEDALQREFVRTSEECDLKQVRTRFAAVFVVAVLIVVCGLLVGLYFKAGQTAKAKTAQTEAESLRAEAEKLLGQLAGIKNRVWIAKDVFEEKPQVGALKAVEALEAAQQLKGKAIESAAIDYTSDQHDAIDQTVRFASDYLRQTWRQLTSASIPNQPLPHAGQPVSALAISPDGRWLVTASAGGKVDALDGGDLFLWRMSNRLQPRQALDFCDERIRTVAFSPDGKWLAAGSDDQGVWIWAFDGDAESPASGPRKLPAVTEGQTYQVWAIAFSRNSRWLATGSDDGVVRIWDVSASTGGAARLAAEIPHKEPVRGLAFGPELILVTGCDDSLARLWKLSESDLGAGPVVTPDTPDHEEKLLGPVRVVVFDPTYKWLVTAGFANTAKLWDLHSLETDSPRVSTLIGHRGTISSAAFDSPGRTLVTGSFDRTARIWTMPTEWRDEITTGTVLGDHDDRIWSVAFGKQWLVTASADKTARLWDVESVTSQQSGVISVPLKIHDQEIRAAVMHPNGDVLVTASEDGTARAWFLKEDTTLRGGSDLTAAAVSSNGQWLATGDRNEAFARLWNVADRTWRKLPHQEFILSAAFDADGQRLLTGGLDGVGRLWSVSDLNESPLQLEGHSDRILVVDLQADGHFLATGSRDMTVRLWTHNKGDNTGEVALPKVIQRSGYVRGIAFSGDGRWLASVGDDGIPKLTDLQPSDPSSIDLAPHEKAAREVAFSANSRWLATGSDDKSVRIWEMESPLSDGAEPKYHLRNTDKVTCLKFSEQGDYLASGSDDGTVRVWDLGQDDAQQEFQELAEQISPITAIAIETQNSKWLAAGSRDGSVRLWRLGSKESVELESADGSSVVGLGFMDDRLLITKQNGQTRRRKAEIVAIAEVRKQVEAIVGRPLHEDE